MLNDKNYLINKEYNQLISKLVQFYLLSQKISIHKNYSLNMLNLKDKLEIEIKEILTDLDRFDEVEVKSYFPQMSYFDLIEIFNKNL